MAAEGVETLLLVDRFDSERNSKDKLFNLKKCDMGVEVEIIEGSSC